MPDYCQPAGKYRYTKSEAKKRAKHIEQYGSRDKTGPVAVFKCGECNGWHIGHRRPRFRTPTLQHRRRRRRR